MKNIFFLQKDLSDYHNTGVRMSPVIPSRDWINIWQNYQSNLHKSRPENLSNYPFFIVDSEGMGIRGNEFDFMINSSPGMMSKNIIWMGILGNDLPILKILEDIQIFLDFLQNINNLLDPMIGPINTNDKNSCAESYFGHLIIVLRTDKSKQDLQYLLMEKQGKWLSINYITHLGGGGICQKLMLLFKPV